jgi:hypothetical protein
MSSFMPSVSILGTLVVSPGEGGGVCSYALPRLLGRSSTFVVTEVMGDSSVGESGDVASLV